MKISSDDPKLTAYALGELDKNEAEQIEREVQNSPELLQVIAEVRETVALLKNELSNEPALSLSEPQKSSVLARTKPDSIIPFPRQRIFQAIGIGAIAACVAFVLTWQFGHDSKRAAIEPRTNSEFRYAQNAISQEQKKRQGTLNQVQSQNLEAIETVPAAIQKPQSPHGEEVRISPFVKSKPAEQNAVESTIPQNFGSVFLDDEKKIEPLSPDDSKSMDLFSAAEGRDNGAFAIPRVSIAQVGQGGGGGGLSELSQRASAHNFGGGYVPYDSRTFSRKISPVEMAESEAVRRQNHAAEPRGKTSGRSVSGSLRGFYDDREGESPNKFEGRFSGEQLIERERDSETARYPKYAENDFQSVAQEPLSTFSIDVDTASYANVRRFLNEDRLPPRDAVRIEELINYFSYNYPQPKGEEPFSANLEVAGCPWNSEHRLVRIGLKGKEIAQGKRPPSNFVFLIDVSGSMSPSERLPLIKQALRMLVKRMTENDRIAIVVYASSSGVVLESTSCANKEKILEALDRLEAGGSTNGGEGVQRAYALAEENFIKGGVNRVILCTDGDFNVGITDQSELVNLIQRKAKSGVFLSALGVGTDNYKDALMQKLADKGNGNYHYIDTMEEAQKVLIQQMNGTLVTIAKDVKIQIEFNPAQVSSYRLIGYEKRILAAEDFNDDKKDAGEIGAGHTVTALYEIIPANGQEDGARGKVDDLKYQKPTPKPKREISNDNPELLTLKLRYKKPDGKTSKLSETAVTDSGKTFSRASSDFKFASAVAGFGMILKNSGHKGEWTFKSVLEVAEKSKSDDKEGYRAEFINMVKKAKALQQSRND